MMISPVAFTVLVSSVNTAAMESEVAGTEVVVEDADTVMAPVVINANKAMARY